MYSEASEQRRLVDLLSSLSCQGVGGSESEMLGALYDIVFSKTGQSERSIRRTGEQDTMSKDNSICRGG
jgi:hypothetical protein